MTISATYDPADDKIRMRSAERLDADTYAKVKAAGFGWAPKQGCFYAVWNPEREDLAAELAGELEDENTTLAERAEVRAERFEGYHEKRAEESERAAEAVGSIADNIPLGQPILVGHHSEKRARKDAQRIENGMRKAVNLWKTAEYWERRARGVLSHVDYKERPDVRARRIKGLEADARRYERQRKNAETFRALWTKIEAPDSLKRKDGQPTTLLERATFVAGRDSIGFYSQIVDGKIAPEAAREQAIAHHTTTIADCDRWLEHLNNRLSYERALLAASGFTPPAKKAGKAALPLLNIRGKVAYRDTYGSRGIIETETVDMTKAQLAAIYPDCKGTRVSGDGTHRLRLALSPFHGDTRYQIVFLTDSKEHERPGQEAVEARASVEQEEKRQTAEAHFARKREIKRDATPPKIAALAESLKAGVQVVAAPNLFVTPPELAQRMAMLADCAGKRVLEPSAGTGNLVRAIFNNATGADNVRVVAVEINQALVEGLQRQRQLTVGANEETFAIEQGDFLQRQPGADLGYFRAIVMNPPFDHGEDIKHVLHAMRFLKAGGILVGICADGPKQNEQIKPLSATWEQLPAGTFEGTNVHAALFTIRG